MNEFEQMQKDSEYVNDQNIVLSESEVPKKKRKTIWTILFILVNIGAIAVTGIIEFTKESVEEIDFLGLNMFFLLAAFGCIVAVIALESLKYCIMMRQTVGKVKVKHAVEVAILGKYYDNITPCGAGGQPFQIYYLTKQGYAPGPAGAMPVLGFLTMQLGFCLLFFITVITNASAVKSAVLHVSAYIGSIFYMAVPTSIILFSFFPRHVTRFLAWGVGVLGKMKIFKNPERTQQKMITSLQEYRNSLAEMAKVKGLILKVAVIGVLYNICLCSIPFFVLRAFGSPCVYFDVFTVTTYIYCAITYIPTPGNAGAAEGTFYSIFSGLHHSFWAMSIWRFLTYYMFLLMGVGVYGYNGVLKRMKKRDE